MKNLKINPSIIYFIMIIYLELLTKIVMTKQVLNTGLIYLIIFTIPIVIVLTILTKSFNQKANRTLSIILMFIISILYGVHFVYFTLFSVPFSFSSITMADQALDFVSVIKDTLLKYWYYILAILAPIIVFLFLQKKIDYTRYHKHTIISLFITLAFFTESFPYLSRISGLFIFSCPLIKARIKKLFTF